MSALLTVFLSLTEDFVEDRMSLAEALQRLSLALADESISMRFKSDQSGGDAAPAQGGGGESTAPPESEEERCCVVCWRNPREVRLAASLSGDALAIATYQSQSGARFASAAATRRCVAAATRPSDRGRPQRSSAPTAERQLERGPHSLARGVYPQMHS